MDVASFARCGLTASGTWAGELLTLTSNAWHRGSNTSELTRQQSSKSLITNIASLRAFASARGRRALSLRQSVRSHLRPGALLKCRKFTCLNRNTSTSAPWRRDRHDHRSCTDRLRDQGRSVSPLCLASGFTLTTFKLDWLHIADLAVGADWLGQRFSFLLPKMRVGNRAARVADFCKRNQGLYTTHPCSSRLDNLTETMLRKSPAHAPKLKAHAAEAKGAHLHR